jgi:chromosome transmission fidelity protein 18
MNVHRVSYIDPTFDRCAAACEWLSSSDLYRNHRSSGMDSYAMEVMHIPTAIAAVHLLCRVEQRQDLTLSARVLSDVHYQKEANKALAQKFVDGLSMQARGTRGARMIAIETVPYVLWALAAGEGSSALDRAATSVDLLSKGVRAAFDDHASTLKNLGLSYVVEHDESRRGLVGVNLRLEPPLDRLVQFVYLPDSRQEIPAAVRFVKKAVPPSYPGRS